jgi:hypothetical protein
MMCVDIKESNYARGFLQIIQQHTPKHTNSSNQPNNILLPPVLLQSLQRPDLPEGCQ